MSTSTSTTARPWYVGPNYLIGGWWVSREADPERQGDPGAEIADCTRREDAEFIARVANQHDALTAALQQARAALGAVFSCNEMDWTCAVCGERVTAALAVARAVLGEEPHSAST